MKNKVNQIYNSNNLDYLKTLEDNCIDTILTDVPYGLQDVNALKMIKEGVNNTSGFMNKSWDVLPSVEMLKEFYRVLKTGAYFVTTFTPRQDLQVILFYRLLEAGFDINFSPIYWCYACLSEDSEVYTRQYGWINLFELQKRLDFSKTNHITTINNIEILVYDKDIGEYRWEVPCKWNVYYNTDTAYRIQSNNTDQIVSAGHNCLIEREGKLLYRKAEELGRSGEVSYAVPYLDELPTMSSNIHSSTICLYADKKKILHEGMQMQSGRLCKTYKKKYTRKGHYAKTLDRGAEDEGKGKNDGGKKLCLERWNNIFKKEGKLCFSINKICKMSARIYYNGKKRWLGCITSFVSCNGNWKTLIKNRVRTSYQSQCGRQQSGKFNVIQKQQRAQTIRGKEKYNTTLATITPIEYNGMIYCPTTKAGSFVARRNGKIFITGNSGFPKASNYAIAIDKHFKMKGEYSCERGELESRKGEDSGYVYLNQRQARTLDRSEPNQVNYEPASEPAKYCDGIYSLGLKPAVEPILLAQKPHNKAKYKQALDWYNERQELLEKNIKEEELCFYTKNASGGVRMNDCRITIEENDDVLNVNPKNKDLSKTRTIGYNGNSEVEYKAHNQGRFPANLLVSDNAVDVNRITKSSFREGDRGLRDNALPNGKRIGDGMTGLGFHDEGDLSRYFSLDNWTKRHYPELYKLSQKTLELEKDAKKISPCLFTPKPSVAEKNIGLEEFELKEKWGRDCASDNWQATHHGNECKMQNTHPTSKPLSLYNYLIHLFSNENDIILDPFSGSGTTCISAVLTNRYYIGIDITEEYCNIARARVEYWKKAKETKLNNQLL